MLQRICSITYVNFLQQTLEISFNETSYKIYVVYIVLLISLDIPTEVFGSKLRQQVEDRLKFYETGDIPAKNVDVMVTALSEVSSSMNC